MSDTTQGFQEIDNAIVDSVEALLKNANIMKHVSLIEEKAIRSVLALLDDYGYCYLKQISTTHTEPKAVREDFADIFESFLSNPDINKELTGVQKGAFDDIITLLQECPYHKLYTLARKGTPYEIHA
jgi:hypothetical protein